MTPEKMFSKLGRDLAEDAGDNKGGVVYVAMDREQQLRDRVGYKGIFNLVRQIRKVLSDNAPDGVEIVRFGVPSLIARVPSSSAEDIETSAKRLFEKVAAHSFKLGRERLALSLSLCACRFDQRFADVDEMILALARRAEELSDAGGNDLAIVEPAISSHKAKASNGHMLGLLMDSLKKDALRARFQPMLSTTGAGPEQVFQLSPRLPANDGETIAQSEFLPIAREASLLPAIDRWMMVQASKTLSDPESANDLHLFVEQSEVLLSDADRRQWLVDLVDKNPHMRGAITIEIGMDDAMAHLQGLSDLAEAARSQDLGLCLNGVDEHSRWDLIGASLPCDYVRMAPDFVGRISEDATLEQRFMELSAPVRDSGARIIMPQVEDSRTAATTWRCGPDYMQGSLIQPTTESIGVEA